MTKRQDDSPVKPLTALMHASAITTGGGESIWQGANVLSTTEIYDSFQDPSGQWRPGPNITAARCGHAAAVSDRRVQVEKRKPEAAWMDRWEAG